VQDFHRVLPVLAGGVDAASDVGAVLGDVVAGQAAGDLLLGFQRADAALREVAGRPDPGVRGEAEHVILAVAAEFEQLAAGFLLHGGLRAGDARDAGQPGEDGDYPIGSLRPSQVKSWITRLQSEELKTSYIYTLHARLAQIMTDAVHDGLIVKSPCSRRTAPSVGEQRVYVATTEQVWQLYERFPDRMRLAVLLGAFVGLRLAEACGLRVEDVDFLRAVVHPKVQYKARPLKTKISKTPVPVPASLVEQCSIQIAAYGRSEALLTGEDGGQLSPWAIERAMRKARSEVKGLPAGFRYHDLRHYFASLLIASGADVKTVQARLRHASAKTTLDTYGHIWPDRDESTRAAVDTVLAAYLTEQRRNSATAQP
jgi:integrase